MATIPGTSGNDTLDGTAADDIIYGYAGDDDLDGRAGNDRLEGGDGDDVLFGGAGNDILIGGAGNDEIDGGNPTFYPLAFDAVDYSSASGSIFVESDGNVTGAAGHDHVSNVRRFIGSNFDDVMEVAVDSYIFGYFRLEGGGGNDTLTGSGWLGGGNGNDVLTANGKATLNGGDGDDILRGGLVLIGGAGDDLLDGGGGADYRSATTAVAVDLALSGPQYTGISTGFDTLVDINSVTGSSFGDHLSGNSLTNDLTGDYGDDVLNGRAGSDSLDGGGGNDILYGGAGNDILGGSEGNDTLYGGADGDHLFGGNGNNVMRGGAGNDIIGGGSGNNLLAGDAGDDRLSGGAGDERLFGGVGIDTAVYGGFGSSVGVNVQLSITDAQDTGLGRDVLRDIENLIAGAGNDRLVGSTGVNTIEGGSGDDRIAGLGGADTLKGDAGNDKIAGGAGNDLLDGDHGTDELLGGAGADTFVFVQFNYTLVGYGDTIDDFEQGSDRIDLSHMDAIDNDAENQAFTFIGSAAFSGALGELRQFDDGAGHTIIEGNLRSFTSETTVADFQIVLKGAYTLQSSDFTL
jgi:Ca2+-binding RTX toxin-like protein